MLERSDWYLKEGETRANIVQGEKAKFSSYGLWADRGVYVNPYWKSGIGMERTERDDCVQCRKSVEEHRITGQKITPSATTC